MPKYIKYLENGQYKYATVKDVGDLLKLKTSTKKDIVSAINELIAGGISGGGDGLTTEDVIEIINNSDAVSTINEDVANIVSEIQGTKDKFNTDTEQIRKELQDRMDTVKANIQKVIDDYQIEQDKKNKEQAENIVNLQNESTQVKNDLAGAKEDLEYVQNELLNYDTDFTEIKQSVNQVKGELDTKVSSEQLDATNGRIDKNTTDINQNKKNIQLKASQESLGLLKGDVEKNTAALVVANDKIEGKVSREELVNDIDDFTVKKANLFTGTREWQGWEESNSAQVVVTDQKDNFGTAVEFFNVSDYISLTVDNLKVGETYTVSVSARSDKNTNGTVAQLFNVGEFQAVDTKDTFVGDTLQRYFVNVVATDESMTFKLGAKSLANQAHLFLSKAKLETGTKATTWEQNENDTYARIEKNESDLTVLSDRVTSTVKKQTETDKKVTQNSTDIAQTSGKVEANIKALQSQDGRITENKAQITATANGLRTEFTQKTNDAIGAITDGGKNLILSSAFQTDPAMKNWQSVNNKVVVKEKNSQNWAYMSQSGLSADSPIGLTSNYFAMKANDPLVIAFDIIIGDVSKLDNKTVLNVAYYDKDDNRVDFKDYTLTDLGIKSPANGATNRAYIKVNTTHDDVVKGAILPRLSRNGEVWMSNFFAKISSISNGDYEVANADLEDMQSTDHFKLEQTAQGLTGKADSSQLNKLSGDLTTLSNNFSTTSSGFQASLSKIDDKVDNLNYDNRNLLLESSTSKSFNVTTSGWGGSKGLWKLSDSITDYEGDLTLTLWGIPTEQADDYTQWIQFRIGKDWGVDNKTTVGNDVNWEDSSPLIVKQADDSYMIVFHMKLSKEYMPYLSYLNVRYVYNIIGWTFTKAKLEKGKKNTPYSLAPEDMATNSALQVAKADIKATADNLSTNYTKTTDEHKYVNSQIKQSADKLEASVASVSDVANAEHTNLIFNGSFKNGDNWRLGSLNTYFGVGASVPISAGTYINFSSPTAADTALAFIQNPNADVLRSITGNTVTMSIYARCQKNGGQIKVYIRTEDADGNYSYFNSSKAYDLTTAWTRYSMTAKLPTGIKAINLSFQFINIAANVVCYATGAMLNMGNVLLPYSESTLDSDAKIAKLEIDADGIKQTVSNKADTSYVNQKANQITTTIGKNKTDADNKINANKKDIDNQISQVKQTASSLSSTVANNKTATDKVINANKQSADTQFSNINQTINGVKTTVNGKADISQVSQLSNQINLVVKNNNTEHTNLILNGSFRSGDNWRGNSNVADTWYQVASGAPIASGHYGGLHGVGNANPTMTQSATNNVILAVKGQKVTLSAYARCKKNVGQFRPYIRTTASDGSYSYFGTGPTWYDLKTGWQRYSVTGTLPSDITAMNLNLQYTNVSDGVKCYFTGAMLTLGDQLFPYQDSTDDIVSQINVDESGVLISGDKVHITGNTTIDNASIDFAKIKNVKIGNAQIDSLDAGKLKTGVLDTSAISIKNSQDGTVLNINSGMLSIYNTKNGNAMSLGEGKLAMGTPNAKGKYEQLGGLYSTYNAVDRNVNGIAIMVQPSSLNIEGFAGDYFTINKQTGKDGTSNVKMAYYANTHGAIGREGFHFLDNVEIHNGNRLMFTSDGTKNSSSKDTGYIEAREGKQLSVVSNGNIDLNTSGTIFLGRQQTDGGGSLFSGVPQGWYMRNNKGELTNIRASAFTKGSTKESKKNIAKADNNKLALDIYNMDITTYNYKSDNSSAKDNIGAVIGNGYNINSSMLSDENDAIKLDNVIFALVGTVQKQAEQISELTARLTLQEIHD